MDNLSSVRAKQLPLCVQVRSKSSWYLAPVHFDHLESAQCLRLLLHLFPQLPAVFRCFGSASRNSFTPCPRHISVYIQTGSDRWRGIIRLAAICCNLSAVILLLLLVVDTKALGHRTGRGEGAPWSLQPLLQSRAQVGMTLRRGRWEAAHRYIICTQFRHDRKSLWRVISLHNQPFALCIHRGSTPPTYTGKDTPILTWLEEWSPSVNLTVTHENVVLSCISTVRT